MKSWAAFFIVTLSCITWILQIICKNFSLQEPLFLSSQIGGKMKSKKCCEVHFIQIPSHLPPHFIHDTITFASSHPYHITFAQHSNIQVHFSSFFFWLTTFLWCECSVNLLTAFLPVTKSFVQLNLYVHYCNFYMIIIKIKI